MTESSPSARARYEITVGVRMTVDDLELLDQLAAQEDRTRSNMLRVLLGEALAARQPTQGRTQ